MNNYSIVLMFVSVMFEQRTGLFAFAGVTGQSEATDQMCAFNAACCVASWLSTGGCTVSAD